MTETHESPDSTATDVRFGNDGIAWALTTTPLIAAFVFVAGRATTDLLYALIATVVAWWILDYALHAFDQSRLPKSLRFSPLSIESGVAALGGLYLVTRAKRLGSGWVFPAIWLASLVVGVVLAVTAAFIVQGSDDDSRASQASSESATDSSESDADPQERSSEFVEADIAAQYKVQADANVSLECPDPVSFEPQTSFECVLYDNDSDPDAPAAFVEVRVQNAAGDYVWEEKG